MKRVLYYQPFIAEVAGEKKVTRRCQYPMWSLGVRASC